MTRDQAERLIERLADKTLSFGCVVIAPNGYPYRYLGKNIGTEKHWYINDVDAVCNDGRSRDGQIENGEILGHPIMLTDVLEKLIKVRYDRLKLVRLWEDCGFTKSLQDIMRDGQFDAPRGKTVPSAPHELFEYLLQLFPERVSTECTHPTASLTNPPKCFDCGEVLGEIL